MSMLEEEKGSWIVESKAVITRKPNGQEYLRAVRTGKLSEGKVEAAPLCIGKSGFLWETKVCHCPLQVENFSL